MIKVASLEAYRAKHARLCRDAEVRVVVDRETPLQAFINEGRYVAKCPECNGGIAIHPDWREAGCPDCGTWFTQIEIPQDRHAIEAVLSERRPLNQNWLPSETVERLRFENQIHAHELRGRRPQRGVR